MRRGADDQQDMQGGQRDHEQRGLNGTKCEASDRHGANSEPQGNRLVRKGFARGCR